MQTVIRMFALFVAIAGLSFAAFASAATHSQPRHASIIVSGPITADYPAPPTCGFDGCVATTSSR
jgi:hypothetical protein